MAQIIKHRRGSLEALSSVTGSLQKGEIVIASGSSNLTTTNGSSLVFAVPENGQVQATNRFLIGDAAPNTFAGSTYNGMVKGVPYYASGSSTLYLLGTDGNDAINLEGNIQPFSASVATAINALSQSIGSGTIGQSVAALNTFSASVKTQLTEIGVVSGSLIASASTAKSTNDTQDGRLDNLESTSASVNISVAALNAYTSSNTSTTALNAFTASAASKFTEIGVVSGSLISSASAAKATNDTQDGRLDSIESFSGSVKTQNIALATITGSLIASASTAKSTNDTQDGRLDSIESFSGSANSKFTEIGVVSGSLIASASNAATAIADLEAIGLTYATTGSNVFYGNQVITGSMYVAYDLIVQGSSSLQYITASAVDLGTNTIILNNDSPAVRFGGISVVDSGSANGASGSLFWDSLNNNWIYQHPSGGAESGQTAILISGPRNSGSMGSEAHITPGKIMVAVGDDHIGDSIITQATDNSAISVAGNVIVTGSITVGTSQVALLGGDNLVTASSQIILSETNGYGDFSGSISASIAAVVANVGSGVGVSISNLNSFSASALTRLDNLESTGSDHESRIGVVEGDISTINGTLSDISTAQGVQDGRLTSLESFSGSVKTQLTQIGVVSGSLIASASAAKSTNDSQGLRLDSIEAFSGSANSKFTEIGVVSGSLILSASAAKSANDSQDVSITNINSFSSSVLTQLTQIGVVSGSLISSASAAKSTNDTQDGRLGNLESKSASVDISIAAFNAYTASDNSSTTALNAFTASAATKFTEIGVVSGSLIASASNAASRLTTLEGTGTIQGVGQGNEVTFAKVTTTGDVVVGGDLVVQGNTVTLNTATLVVEDKLITLASGSTSSATADGAGIEVAGANANFVYQHSTTAFTSSVALIAPAVTASVNLGTTAGSTKRIAFRNTNGNLDLVPTASVAGDLLQWDGTDFVMSNTIDGGSF